MYSTEAYNKVKLLSTLYMHKRKEKNDHCLNSILLKLGQTSYQITSVYLFTKSIKKLGFPPM